MSLGHVDVPAEGFLLRAAAILAGAVEVEPRLTDNAYAWMRCQAVNLGPGVLEGAVGAGQRRRLVRVDGDPAHQRVMPLDQVDSPAGAGQVAPDLHDARHADSGRCLKGILDGDGVDATVEVDVEVAVVVDNGHPQRFRRRRPRRPPRHQPPTPQHPTPQHPTPR